MKFALERKEECSEWIEQETTRRRATEFVIRVNTGNCFLPTPRLLVRPRAPGVTLETGVVKAKPAHRSSYVVP